MENAFYYLMDNGGSVDEVSYPYTGVSGQCKTDQPSTTKVTESVTIKKDATSLKNAIIEFGSLAICVDANEWSYYGGGIFKARRVGAINHAVNLIGWGYDTVLKENYWLIRNSWGGDWGENGYIRVSTTAKGTFNPKYTSAVRVE